MSTPALAEPVTRTGGLERLIPPPNFFKRPKPLRRDTPDAGELFLPSSQQLPWEDNEVLESDQHRITIDALIRSLKQHWAGRKDFIVGGDMFVYFSPTQVQTYDYRGPDFFVVRDVDGTYSRQVWVAWEEKWRLPDVIIELLSDSTKAIDLGLKKTLYEQTFQTTDYFVFDPLDAHSLRGWHLSTTGQYEELKPNPQGRLWSAKLELWVGVWDGPIENESRPWLRFYEVHGQLVQLPEEAAVQEAKTAKQEAELAKQETTVAKQKAKEAERRAELLAEQLRRLGLDPDHLTG